MDVTPTTSRREPAAAGSFLVPALVAVAAPASVVASLSLTSNAMVTFAIYHVLFCLLGPPLILRWAGNDRAEVLDHLALRSPSPGGWLAGTLAGVLAAVAIALPALTVARPLLSTAAIGARVAEWGFSGSAVGLFVYMLVFNSVGEEVLWRGYVHTEAVGRLGVVAGVALVASAFASYHLYTLLALTGDGRLSLLGGIAVLAGALAWGVLRERYDSTVPAILAHAGATAGYMTVFVVLT